VSGPCSFRSRVELWESARSPVELWESGEGLPYTLTYTTTPDGEGLPSLARRRRAIYSNLHNRTRRRGVRIDQLSEHVSSTLGATPQGGYVCDAGSNVGESCLYFDPSRRTQEWTVRTLGGICPCRATAAVRHGPGRGAVGLPRVEWDAGRRRTRGRAFPPRARRARDPFRGTRRGAQHRVRRKTLPESAYAYAGCRQPHTLVLMPYACAFAGGRIRLCFTWIPMIASFSIFL
jgi:hypothetical protein